MKTKGGENMTKQQINKYERYIIASINGENYDVVTYGRKQKLQFLFDTFKKEVGWNIERVGEYEAFKGWTMGLPTVFNIEFENYKILELAKKIGTLDKKATGEQEDRIIDNYWNFITNLTFKMFKNYKVS